MNLKEMKARAKALADLVAKGEASDVEVTEFRTLVPELETRISDADLAARAVIAANNGEGKVVEVTTPKEEKIENRSSARQFAESDEVKGFVTRGAAGTTGRVATVYSNRNTVVTGTTYPQTTQIYVAPAQIKNNLQNAVTRMFVPSNSVEVLRLVNAPQSAVVAEGATKPESAVTWTQTVEALKTVANWIGISRQAAADTNWLEGLLTGWLQYNVDRSVEALIATALSAALTDGSALAINATTGVDLVAAVRNGIAVEENYGYDSSVVVLNPTDYAALDLLAYGRALASGEGPTSIRAIWGLQVVTSPLIAAGAAYVGDFKMGIHLYDRGVQETHMTDSHASNFTANILTLLTEIRVLPVIVISKAICKVTVA